MLIDARSLPQDQIISSDICIVGGGTAGITLARELAWQPFSVCLLESGGEKPERESHALNAGTNIGRPYFPLDTARARVLGGCSGRWLLKLGNGHLGARLRPMDAIDFESKDWVPYSGWPFTGSHLAPFYERAQKVCRVEPAGFEPQQWSDDRHRPVLKLESPHAQTVIFKFGSRDPFIRDYIEEIAKAENIHIYLHANVLNIDTDEYGRVVNRLQVACMDARRFTVTARLVVLAVGGLESPRLLLLSNQSQPCGLGNHHDRVGRFFMEHLHFRLGYLVPFDPALISQTGLYNGVHLVDDVPVIGKIALTAQAIRREKLLNFVTQLNPRVIRKGQLAHLFHPDVPSGGVASYKVIRKALSRGKRPEDFSRHLANGISGLGGIGITAIRKIRRDLSRMVDKSELPTFWLENMSEQAPNPDSRVTLSGQEDRLGQRRINLDWRLSEFDIRSAMRSQQILDNAFQAAGLGRLYSELNPWTPAEKITGGWHQMGTTRMHRDPRQGVVDENSRVHGIDNLFIAGPSVFPTCGYANPVLTIVAMTIRLADHIKLKMKAQ